MNAYLDDIHRDCVAATRAIREGFAELFAEVARWEPAPYDPTNTDRIVLDARVIRWRHVQPGDGPKIVARHHRPVDPLL